jgi:hypothetical protein
MHLRARLIPRIALNIESKTGVGIYKLETPAASLRDWIGNTTSSEIPKLTVSPMQVEMTCNTVLKPEMYATETSSSAVLRFANVSRPLFARPEGS